MWRIKKDSESEEKLIWNKKKKPTFLMTALECVVVVVPVAAGKAHSSCLSGGVKRDGEGREDLLIQRCTSSPQLLLRMCSGMNENVWYEIGLKREDKNKLCNSFWILGEVICPTSKSHYCKLWAVQERERGGRGFIDPKKKHLNCCSIYLHVDGLVSWVKIGSEESDRLNKFCEGGFIDPEKPLEW